MLSDIITILYYLIHVADCNNATSHSLLKSYNRKEVGVLATHLIIL